METITLNILDTFPSVRRKDEEQYGDAAQSTKRLVLENYARLGFCHGYTD